MVGLNTSVLSIASRGLFLGSKFLLVVHHRYVIHEGCHLISEVMPSTSLGNWGHLHVGRNRSMTISSFKSLIFLYSEDIIWNITEKSERDVISKLIVVQFSIIYIIYVTYDLIARSDIIYYILTLQKF